VLLNLPAQDLPSLAPLHPLQHPLLLCLGALLSQQSLAHFLEQLSQPAPLLPSLVVLPSRHPALDPFLVLHQPRQAPRLQSLVALALLSQLVCLLLFLEGLLRLQPPQHLSLVAVVISLLVLAVSLVEHPQLSLPALALQSLVRVPRLLPALALLCLDLLSLPVLHQPLVLQVVPSPLQHLEVRQPQAHQCLVHPLHLEMQAGSLKPPQFSVVVRARHPHLPLVNHQCSASQLLRPQPPLPLEPPLLSLVSHPAAVEAVSLGGHLSVNKAQLLPLDKRQGKITLGIQLTV
jgi:hypothetical protein